MPTKNFLDNLNYASLAEEIQQIAKISRENAYHSVNSILLQTYWKIGQKIVEFEQKGKLKG